MVFVGRRGMTISCRNDHSSKGFIWDIKETPRALLDPAYTASRGIRDLRTPTTDFSLKEVGLIGSFVVKDSEWVEFYLESAGFISPYPTPEEFRILVRATELNKFTEFVERYWADN